MKYLTVFVMFFVLVISSASVYACGEMAGKDGDEVVSSAVEN